MKRQIMWVSQHLEIDTMTGKLKEENPRAIYHDDENDDNEEIHNVISTPFGLWRVDDAMNPYKQFKLWMAHTNFTINEKVADLIKCIPGVEVLTILTRYRFMIGVGEMFNIRDVRTSIERALKCSREELSLITDESVKTQVEELKEKLSKEGRYAIYIFPNSNIDFVSESVGSKKFNEKLLLYQKAVDHSSGILIESSDD